MEEYKCDRCNKEQKYIPTHQFVKFDEKQHYLCDQCWFLFKRFFLYGPTKDTGDLGW